VLYPLSYGAWPAAAEPSALVHPSYSMPCTSAKLAGRPWAGDRAG